MGLQIKGKSGWWNSFWFCPNPKCSESNKNVHEPKCVAIFNHSCCKLLCKLTVLIFMPSMGLFWSLLFSEASILFSYVIRCFCSRKQVMYTHMWRKLGPWFSIKDWNFQIWVYFRIYSTYLLVFCSPEGLLRLFKESHMYLWSIEFLKVLVHKWP